MNKKNDHKKIVIFQESKKMFGFIVKEVTNKIVVVNIDGKTYVGRRVQNWIEL